MTYVSQTKHFKLYTKIHGPNYVKACQIKLVMKENITIKCGYDKYKASVGKGDQGINTKFSLSASTDSIDGFNAKVKISVLQQRKN